MYHIFKGNKFVAFAENYRKARAYCENHHGCRMVYMGGD